MAIAVTDKGTATAYDDVAPINQIVKSGVSIAAGASVIVVVALDNAFGGVGGASWNGQALTLDEERENVGDCRVVILSKHGCSAGTGQVVITTANSVQEAGMAIGALQATGLLTASVLDKSAGDTGSSASPSSGATAATAVADELLVGAVAMSTPGAVGGSWGGSFTALHDANTAVGLNDIALSTAYRIVSATGAYTASKSGATNAAWGAVITTYKSNVTIHALAGIVTGAATIIGVLAGKVLEGIIGGTATITGRLGVDYALRGVASADASMAGSVDVVSSAEYRRREIGDVDYRERGIDQSQYRERLLDGPNYRERLIEAKEYRERLIDPPDYGDRGVPVAGEEGTS